jgi:hypothetical protein
MSGSRANRTAAIIDAAITNVEAKSILSGAFRIFPGDGPPHLAHQ